MPAAAGVGATEGLVGGDHLNGEALRVAECLVPGRSITHDGWKC
jgi:hypothetical protein